MELLTITKNIAEMEPSLVSGCMLLKGIQLHPKEIESLLIRDSFGELTLNQVIDIASYTSAFEFIEVCKNQGIEKMSGNLVIALANYLMRTISIKTSFIVENVDLGTVIRKLDTLFYQQETCSSLAEFLQYLLNQFRDIKFLKYDNEAMLFLLINFYLYVEKNQVLVFSDIYGDANEKLGELQEWIIAWRG